MKNIMFFHGAAADIKRFDEKYIGQNFEKDEEGFFFTTNTNFEVVKKMNGEEIYEDMYSAGAYAINASKKTGNSPVVYPVFLDCKNPLTMEDIIDEYCLSEKDPYDGCTQQEYYDENTENILELMKNKNKDSIMLDWNNEIFAVVFSPNQIRFALLEGEK